MSLSEEDRNTLIDFRMEKSDEAMKDVELLVGNGRWTAAANRLYYAAYYAVSALMLCYRIEAKTHEGIIRMFSKEFVLTGIFEVKYGRLYSDLYTKRITGDYSDSFNVEQVDVEPLVEPTHSFIEKMKALVNAKRNS